MGKKLLALALVGAAVYLFKTKKGEEMRKQVMDYAGKAMDSMREKYGTLAGAAQDAMKAQTA